MITEKGYEEMNIDLIERPMYLWWDKFKKREELTFWAQILVALIGIVLFSSEVHHVYNLLIHAESVTTGERSLTFAYIMFVFFMAQACLAVIFASTKAYNIISNDGADIWDSGFSKGVFSSVTVVSKFMPARKIEGSYLGLFKDSPKSFLFQDSSKPQVIYNIAETNDYLVRNFIFGVRSKFRTLSILAIASIMVIVIGLLSGGSSIVSVATFIVMLGVSLVMTEFVVAALVEFSNDSKIKKVVNNKQTQDNLWCEYDIAVQRHRVGGAIASLVLGGVKLKDITDVDTSSASKIEATVNNIEKLVDITYLVVHLVNAYDSDKQFAIEATQRREDIKDLLLMLNVYLPACVNEVYNSLVMISTNEKIRSSDLDVVKAYEELHKDLAEQNKFLLDMKNRYEGTVKNTILSDFRKVIDRRSKGWQGGDVFEVYSLKTQVLDTSLNQKLIPELEYLMKGADDVSREKIQSKIDEIKSFFNEQVALDEQAVSNQMLEYDRSVSIDANSGIIPTADAVTSKLKQVDHYLNGLKRSW